MGSAALVTRRNDMETLGDALPNEQARVREILGHYREIGPAGAFGAAMIEASLRKADAAVMSGDLPAMIDAYNDLKEYKE
jgi:hypothetical protein